MKRIVILGAAFTLLTGLSILACVNGGDVGKNNLINAQTGTKDENDKIADDFCLTVTEESTLVKQGEDFLVIVELKNISGKDYQIYCNEITYMPYIPNWDPFKDRFVIPAKIVRKSNYPRTKIGRYDYGFQFIFDSMPEEKAKLTTAILNKKLQQR